MSAANEAWIQDSLTRLEQLESYRQQIGSHARPDELAEIDEEIRSLYEVLEAAAEEPDGASAPAAANQPHAPHVAAVPQAAFVPAPAPAMSAAPFGMAPAAYPAAPATSPFEVSPFAAPPVQQGFAAPSPTFAPAPSFESSSYDAAAIDDEPRRSAGPVLGVALVALLGLGGAGYWVFGRSQPPPPAPTPAATESQVFKAGAIPEDTQEPQVAKGGDASRTPHQTIKGPSEEPRRASSGSRSSGSSSRPEPEPAGPPSRSIKVDSTNDPLAGVK